MVVQKIVSMLCDVNLTVSQSQLTFVCALTASAKASSVNDPNAKHIYGLFFHQERYPATHLPIQLGLPTSPILSKHSPTVTHPSSTGRLGDYKA